MSSTGREGGKTWGETRATHEENQHHQRTAFTEKGSGVFVFVSCLTDLVG